MSESTATPHEPGSEGRGDHGSTLAGLPDDAPDELRATLSGGDPEQLPTDVPPEERDRDADRPSV